MKITSETHEQAMMCTACMLSGFTPPEHFPQNDGLWDNPCPRCGKHAVWVTQPREKEPVADQS